MKQLRLLASLLIATLTISCVQHNEVGVKSETITISVSLKNPTPNTKTSLGDKTDDGKYPILWSEGDKIVMNGKCSEAIELNNEDNRRGSFTFLNALLDSPYHITYPYTEGSSCTKSNPTVVFPAVQSYVEGTFDKNSAPMCAYTTDLKAGVVMTPLAGALRFPLLASVAGTTIKSISISAGEGVSLAGEFAVDCENGTITPLEGKTQSYITYSLGDGLELSQTEAKPVFITLPKGDFGACAVAITDSNNETMMLRWTAKNIKGGVVREFSNIRYKAKAVISINGMDSEQDDLYSDGYIGSDDLTSESDEIPVDYIPDLVFGYVKDSAGNPLANISISDGFQIVQTDENGFYQFKSNPDSYHIFFTLPAEYEVPINEHGQPCFFKKFSYFHSRYDFTLTPLSGGVESKFILFGMADPQVSSDAGYNRFIGEAVPKIKDHADSYSENCYGVVLGDIITMSTESDKTNYMYQMRNGFAVNSCGMPAFYVMGNHDHCYHNATEPLKEDWMNSTYNLKAQRTYEKIFGPANYSFNRGNAHIICMRNILFKTVDTPSEYRRGFSKEQYDWLVADLANVPTDKLVIFCVHIPIFDHSNDYIEEILTLLNQYNTHILSGHMHYQRNWDHGIERTTTKYANVFEHNISAVCGAWWSSCINGDGTPNGYKVFEIEGNQITDWYYQGYPNGMNDRNYQMRLYRGNAITGAEKPADEADNPNGTKGYFAFNFADDVILANVFDMDREWVVEVYENGNKTGEMEWLYETGNYTATFSVNDLIGDYTMESPRRAPDNYVLIHDFWAHGVQMGVIGRSTGKGGSFTPCYNLLTYKLTNKDAEVKVVARNRFGKEYECSTFSDYSTDDIRYAVKP